jgi:NitT/TauT family transport system substrate-binding protein
MRSRPRILLAALLALLALLGAACGDDDDTTTSADDAAATTAAAGDGSDSATTAPTSVEDDDTTLRLGYFPNVTHATAIVGVEHEIFAEALGTSKLETSLFNAGPAAVEALFAGALDATYIGPNPAINAFAKDDDSIRIISGATSGGAFLVTKADITDAEGLRDKKIATPQLGNTQDVALRFWLKEQGLETTPEGGGDVSIVPQENSQTLETFKAGQIDGAWVPEPWATRLIQEGGGKVLLDESTLWDGGEYVTTHLIVRKEFLEEHPAVVRKLIEGQIAANKFVNENAEESKTIVNDAIEKYTGKRIADDVIDSAWSNLKFTDDPIAASLFGSAEHAEAVDLLEPVELDGIYDLSILNEALEAAGLPEVKDS